MTPVQRVMTLPEIYQTTEGEIISTKRPTYFPRIHYNGSERKRNSVDAHSNDDDDDGKSQFL